MMAKSYMNLSVRIRAFEWLWIKRTIQQLELISRCFSFLILHSRVILPERKTQYTVIRSPHVDKHSREQYEKRTYHAIVEWTPISLKYQHSIHTLVRILQFVSYTGVELEIRVCYSTGLCENLTRTLED